MRAICLPLLLLAWRGARPARACTYDAALGTSVQCATAPLAATAANEEDAPGGVVNLGGTGLPSVYAVLSDWGGQGAAPFTTAGQVAASKAMNSVCSVSGCKAVLSAGNNFLPAGLPGGAEEALTKVRVSATWNDVYGLGPALAVPWYLTGGWRDWAGNVTAERSLTVASTATGAMTWHFPQLWQSLSFVVPPGYSTLQVLMLDTVTLLGEMEPPGQSFSAAASAPAPAVATVKPAALAAATLEPAAVKTAPRVAAKPAVTAAAVAVTAAPAAVRAAPAPALNSTAAARAVPLTKPVPAAAAAVTPRGAARRLADFNGMHDPPLESAVQWSWLENELTSSTADWLIVVGNDPLWSAGESGPAPGLADRLLPLMQAAGVSLYVGGRDPVAQHFAPVASAPDVDVIVVGNGAAGNATQATLLPSKAACPAGALQFAYGGGAGFATLSFALPAAGGNAAALTVTFYDADGTSLYSFTKNATRAGKAAPPPVRGLHGNRSGLVMLLMLAVLIAAGLGHWAKMAMDPPEPEPAPKPRAKPARPRDDDDEARALLGGKALGARFNTFSL